MLRFSKSLHARAICVILSTTLLSAYPLQAEPKIELKKGDRICLIGSAVAERFQYFGYFETLLHKQLADRQLVVRNLGFCGDEVRFRPRSLDFGSPDEHLSLRKADVVLAFFGFNESFGAADGLATFESELESFIQHTLNQQYNGESAPRLVLFSPLAHEDVGNPNYHNGHANNGNLEMYTDAMGRIAEKHGVPFIDLFHLTQQLYQSRTEPYTFNGIHLSESGCRRLAPFLVKELVGASPEWSDKLEPLRAEVNEKDFNNFHDYRAVNGYYIYGGRSRRDHSNPPYTDAYVIENERAKLREMAAIVDKRIWTVAAGGTVSAEPDYSGTRQLYNVPTNFKQPVDINPPEEAIKDFTVAEGYEVNLFASEQDWPELRNPVNFTFDTRGRLWVATMPSYPQYLPPHKPNDKLLIFEDSNRDGVADKMTIFADGLHLPTGFELGDGGAYVAQEPNVTFLKDTDGDGQADLRKIVLHGFDSGDSHHAIGAFVWGPGGGLYMHEGTFHHTQVETPWGPQRNAHGAVYRFDPTRHKFEVFISYNFANPWGHCFDRWGQNFVADASGGANYFGTAFSTRHHPFTGQPDYGPFKFTYQEQMQQFFPKRVRPTAGCELVSSRHFPPEAQGNYLLNNCIGFQGVLQHKVVEEKSGFVGTEIEPLLVSSDRNFRPTDLQIGPDGALYVVDWFNPLVGHMQHSLRDPNRDHSHGRIWRVRYPSRPLVEPVQIEGQPLDVLFDLLATYEDRTRQQVRTKLREFPTANVMAAMKQWLQRVRDDEDFEHHQLEALWVCQHHNVVNDDTIRLLQNVLTAKDYHARAAATRVLGFWRDRLPAEVAIGLLRGQANDEHPRVRLEAVRAASWFDDPGAAEAALDALKHPTDYYIDYTLRHTIDRLEEFWKPVVGSGQPFAVGNPKAIEYVVSRISTPDLINMTRNETVYREMVSRPQIVPQYRREAIAGLARLRNVSYEAQLVDVVRELDHSSDETADQVLADLARLVSGHPATDMTDQRDAITTLATDARRPITRRLANVALITVDRSADRVWNQARHSSDRLRDVVESVPMIADRQVRASLYDRLVPLVDNLPTTLGGHGQRDKEGQDARDSMRRAALSALSYIPGRDAETFRLLAPHLNQDSLRATVVRSISRLRRSNLPPDDIRPVVDELLTYIESVPAKQRTQAETMEAIQLGKDLAALLPKDAAIAVRRQLAELAVNVIVVRPIPHRMQYDRTHIYVQAGKPVEIVFENTDIMPHNLVITIPGAREEVGILAEKMGALGAGHAQQFVPDSPKVLFATQMLQPEQRERLQITAPTAVGDYPYVCTFPGHWRSMYGTLHVVEDIEDIPLDVEVHESPDDIAPRQFVRQWTVDDLFAFTGDLDSGRSFANGQRLFKQMSCIQCHAMNKEGGLFGPDLAIVKEKMANRRITLPDLLESLVMPSKVIEAEYRTQVITDDRGKLYSGVVVFEDEQVVKLMANPLDENCQVEQVSKDTIDERDESKVSIMPEGLLNTMTRDEIVDLLAYVISGADPQHPSYRQ